MLKKGYRRLGARRQPIFHSQALAARVRFAIFKRCAFHGLDTSQRTYEATKRSAATGTALVSDPLPGAALVRQARFLCQGLSAEMRGPSVLQEMTAASQVPISRVDSTDRCNTQVEPD